MKDKRWIMVFTRLYQLAAKHKTESFKINSSVLHKCLNVKNRAEFKECLKCLQSNYYLPDCFTLKGYDYKKGLYNFNIDFLMSNMAIMTNNFRKRTRKVFNPALLQRHLYPRYTGKKIILNIGHGNL